VDIVVDVVLDGALLGRKLVAERLHVAVGGRDGQLRLDARLQAALGLGLSRRRQTSVVR